MTEMKKRSDMLTIQEETAQKEQESRQVDGYDLMEKRKLVKTLEKKIAPPVTFSQYQAGWHAFQELPTVNNVAKASGVSKLVAAEMIEFGWPDVEMPPLAKRLSDIRRATIAKENQDASAIMQENARMLRTVKARIAKELGPGFQNLTFKEGAFQDLNIDKLGKLAKALDTLFRLETAMLGKESGLLGELPNPAESDGELSRLVQGVKIALKKGERSQVIDIEPEGTEES